MPVIAGWLILVGCAAPEGASTSTSSSSLAAATVPAPTIAAAVPPSTTVESAGELAPSQVSASTVARPSTPPACDPAQLTMHAAEGADPATVAAITITNGGDVWCEVDVFESPSVDPLMEPDVWLEPGASAELVVAEVDPGCAQPVELATIELVVNGVDVGVPVPGASACTPQLIALYPV